MSVTSYCGVQQHGWLDGYHSGGQSYGSSIALSQAQEYNLEIWVRINGSQHRMNMNNKHAIDVSFLLENGSTIWTQSFPLSSNDGGDPSASNWTLLKANVTTPITSANVTLRIMAADGGEEWQWWLGSVSLTPRNVWSGNDGNGDLRSDVVAAMKDLMAIQQKSTPQQTYSQGSGGLLRYPGGCFSAFYRWKVGLLDRDRRPPIATPPDFCAAVAGGVDAYTDGVVSNGGKHCCVLFGICFNLAGVSRSCFVKY